MILVLLYDFVVVLYWPELLLAYAFADYLNWKKINCCDIVEKNVGRESVSLAVCFFSMEGIYMKMKWMAVVLSGAMMAALLPGVTVVRGEGSSEASENSAAGTEVVTNLSKIDPSAWQYNADDDVYYQIGISYCETPADTTYETLAVFVPGSYMTGTENGDGTWTCEINSEGTVGSYTAENAPIVMPINTPGYSAQSALTDYTSVTEYTGEGFVYVHAGCRGRDAGAPAGVTDLKAAVRYVRYTDDTLPGDAESIFTFGMSGGGAQSSLMGSTGDSSLYEPYLEQIGAVSGVSDAGLGSMCWCPITSIEAFVSAFKSASKNLGAFDQLDGGQGENTLFGYGDGNGAHFDATLAGILSELENEYASAYAEDLTKTDSAGNTVDVRLNMYTPLYYLLESEEGYQTSQVAKYWRIRTGIAQGDCALATEMDLALALENIDTVESVDFETIWGAGHTQAERTGNSTDNFIQWVNDCMSTK